MSFNMTVGDILRNSLVSVLAEKLHIGIPYQDSLTANNLLRTYPRHLSSERKLPRPAAKSGPLVICEPAHASAGHCSGYSIAQTCNAVPQAYKMRCYTWLSENPNSDNPPAGWSPGPTKQDYIPSTLIDLVRGSRLEHLSLGI